MKSLIVATIILTTATLSFAAENGYVPDRDNSLWAKRGWSGEYPGPGLKLSKKITFKGAAKLTDILSGSSAKIKKCTFAEGNYHPWAQKTKATYASTSQVTTFVAKAETTVSYSPADGSAESTITLKAGDKLRELSYLAEGYCTIEVNGKPADAQCLGMDEKLEAEKSNNYYSSEEGQFVNAACSGKGETGTAWIKVDSALFQIDGIDESEITGYGSIKE